ncbi:hypothetical protein MKX01_009477 [Papaver californicum]|nr:hypothetical protein MKX01_009477 [Papaver californicum]
MCCISSTIFRSCDGFNRLSPQYTCGDGDASSMLLKIDEEGSYPEPDNFKRACSRVGHLQCSTGDIHLVGKDSEPILTTAVASLLSLPRLCQLIIIFFLIR